MPPRVPSTRLAAKERALRLSEMAAIAEKNKKRAASPTKGPNKKQKVSPANKAATAASRSNVPRVDDFRRIRGRRGQLKVMTELPIDVLMEIFGHLEPYDLLCLSRASKGLRAIIVGEQTSSLWKNAYENVGNVGHDVQRPPPPECPPQTNILYYTDFLFGRGCQFCGASKATIVHWGGRTRMCNKCSKTQLIPRDYMAGSLIMEAQELCTVCYMRKTGVLRHNNYMLKQEFDRHVRELQNCVDKEAKDLYKATWEQHWHANVLFTKEVQTWVVSRKHDMINARAQIQVTRRDAITTKLKEAGYGPELATGRYRVQFLPGGYLTVPLTEKGKLTLSLPIYHRWDKIKGQIIGVYEWQRQETRKSHIICEFQNRMQHLSDLIQKSLQGSPKPLIYAPTSNIARSEPFAAVMKEYVEGETNTNLMSSKQKMDALEDKIPEFLKAWRIKADRFLLGLLSGTNDQAAPSVDGEGEPDRKPLELATTFFKCHCSCAEPISYPRILMHACLRNHKIPDRDEDEAPREEATGVDEDADEDEAEGEQAHEEQDSSTKGETHSNPNEVYGIPTVTADGVWNKMSSWSGALWNESDMIELDDEAMGFARAIVQACGEDPNTLTAAAMNERDVRVECMRCVPAPGKRTTGRTRHIMTWKAAILHDIGYHFEEPPTAAGWKLLTSKVVLKRVKALENKLLPNEKRSRTVVIVKECCYCYDPPYPPHPDHVPGSKVESIANLQIGRGGYISLDELTVERHICPGVDAPMKGHPHPVKI